MNNNIAIFPISATKIKTWKPLQPEHSSPVDCAINVLEFFDLLKKTNATELAALKNTTRTGTLTVEITYFLDNYDLKHKHDFFELHITAEDFLDLLNKKLKPNTGIIALMGRPTGMGHFMIFAKDKHNNVYILDPQNPYNPKLSNILIASSTATAEELEQQKQQFLQYIQTNDFSRIHTVSKSPAVKRQNAFLKAPLEETKIQIRKQKPLPNPPAKKRKLNNTKKRKRNQSHPDEIIHSKTDLTISSVPKPAEKRRKVKTKKNKSKSQPTI